MVIYDRAMPSTAPPYLSFAAWLTARHGGPVRKIVLDAGADCPNRDGTLARGGCVFCPSHGAGSGLHAQGLSLTEQWNRGRARLDHPRHLARHVPPARKMLYIAYLQSFSNTHLPLVRLGEVLKEIETFDNLAAIALGTRPDCLDAKKMDRIAASQDAPGPDRRDVWLELGLQSANEATLRRVNRGHGVACLVDAVAAARSRGLLVCLHLMAGLPGEGREDWLRTVDLAGSLDIQAVKFHNLLVLDTAPLASLWRRGDYAPPARETMAAWLAEGLARLRPDVIIQRLTADARPGELLAPAWAADKNGLRQAILDHLQARAWRQGSLHGTPLRDPA